mmetsp:Transcript_23557/g.75119  ORF Transcript_23557/g.75119 Transcript_23557/m.75119 type:complete len:232 (-) Transcript_23557:1910-2605(-)
MRKAWCWSGRPGASTASAASTAPLAPSRTSAATPTAKSAGSGDRTTSARTTSSTTKSGSSARGAASSPGATRLPRRHASRSSLASTRTPCTRRIFGTGFLKPTPRGRPARTTLRAAKTKGPARAAGPGAPWAFSAVGATRAALNGWRFPGPCSASRRSLTTSRAGWRPSTESAPFWTATTRRSPKTLSSRTLLRTKRHALAKTCSPPPASWGWAGSGPRSHETPTRSKSRG